MPDGGRAQRSVRMQAPVQIGDVVLADAAETGVNVIATRMVETV
ncbi:DUF1667 domain-containing protein [Faecalibaculum rodentium]|nr:DUF1667 domain-containing protein [Faecalibaculum rodentium]